MLADEKKPYENKPSNLPARLEKKGVVVTIAGVMPAPLSGSVPVGGDPTFITFVS
ncbi:MULTISPECIES: hypothetical protein [unclassified Mesorhizobium]|uniref:hypothetical protein n=1 Tax=unclassified Mesorhizobium TaxID=325217 RepID=UPI002415611E|nr:MULTISPECIES: hypothetical protein [unclassified Mesorhizobium]MDG4890059.1 hypothetical protein [Mesorhizobium sp. WSM4887]MDG4904201.1 hypothetical protein [Mesorhizobium sp. WSM4962]MDG4909228.1 hypothetical protein [Mesorhizobium sp. WSM4898]MDG4921852.1 hypothetical protein [Mesorhizobium sp. WSM4989]